MSFFAEGRLSDSPYVESVWRGQSAYDFSIMCPVDGRWNIRVARLNGKTQVFVEGSLTKAIPKTHVEGTEWLVIKFRLGAFMPCVPIKNLLDGEAILPDAVHKSFWLNSAAWQLPDYENADTFVGRLVRDEVLLWDPIVNAVLHGQPPDISLRTVRHHFLRTTGLSQNYIRQIERARHAADLLDLGVPILDTVYQAGYADQPHLTRSLKRFLGQTPVQIAQMKKPEHLANLFKTTL